MLKVSLSKKVRKIYQPKSTLVAGLIKDSLVSSYKNVFIDVVIVDAKESALLNQQLRHKNYPTNVISLEYGATRDEFGLLSGELILCDEVIVNEAVTQNRDVLAHYAHMIVHGALHLQGFDHQTDDDASEMERLEIAILKKHGFSDPYA